MTKIQKKKVVIPNFLQNYLILERESLMDKSKHIKNQNSMLK